MAGFIGILHRMSSDKCSVGEIGMYKPCSKNSGIRLG